MNDAEKKPELQGQLREFLVMRNLYEAAARQLTLKFEILNDEFSVLYARNPIHHIESRVKTPESIAAPSSDATGRSPWTDSTSRWRPATALRTCACAMISTSVRHVARAASAHRTGRASASRTRPFVLVMFG